jgi:exodeoxyribonuclease-3
MPLTVATWNINSVRLRMPIVQRLLKEQAPDVLCLQETKCPDDLFPFDPLRAAGYEHIEINGQKGYHGVAIIARRPIEIVERRDFCDKGDCRHLSVRVAAGAHSVLLHNFYVPAGGDEPDPEINWKFKHKLDFVDEMRSVPSMTPGFSASILVGDLNIAPHANDVWSHKQLLNVVSHTPVETEGLEAMRELGGWADLMRVRASPEEKLYTWWSYRARDWKLSNRGRRLDHIWSSSNIRDSVSRLDILSAARGWERPSDHVPVIATFDLD